MTATSRHVSTAFTSMVRKEVYTRCDCGETETKLWQIIEIISKANLLQGLLRWKLAELYTLTFGDYAMWQSRVELLIILLNVTNFSQNILSEPLLLCVPHYYFIKQFLTQRKVLLMKSQTVWSYCFHNKSTKHYCKYTFCHFFRRILCCVKLCLLSIFYI